MFHLVMFNFLCLFQLYILNPNYIPINHYNTSLYIHIIWDLSSYKYL